MTEAEIIEANKVIAPFDGWEEWIHAKGCWHHPERNITSLIAAEDFNYHASWDALMPVVEKIQSMGYSVELGNNHYCCICLFEKDSFEGVYFSTEVDPVKGKVTSKIMGVFLVVHQFIQWYNTQTESNAKDKN